MGWFAAVPTRKRDSEISVGIRCYGSRGSAAGHRSTSGHPGASGDSLVRMDQDA